MLSHSGAPICSHNSCVQLEMKMFFYSDVYPLLLKQQISLMSRNLRKRTFRHVCPDKFQISLGIRAVIRIFTRCIFDRIKSCCFIHTENRDSDQTAQIRSLNRVFVGPMSEGTFSHDKAHMMNHMTILRLHEMSRLNHMATVFSLT